MLLLLLSLFFNFVTHRKCMALGNTFWQIALRSSSFLWIINYHHWKFSAKVNDLTNPYSSITLQHPEKSCKPSALNYVKKKKNVKVIFCWSLEKNLRFKKKWIVEEHIWETFENGFSRLLLTFMTFKIIVEY